MAGEDVGSGGVGGEGVGGEGEEWEAENMEPQLPTVTSEAPPATADSTNSYETIGMKII